MMLESCLEKEQKAPDQIMRVIPYVDAAAIKSCDVLTRAYAGGSYQGFAGCLGLIIMTSVLDGKLELSFPKRPRER